MTARVLVEDLLGKVVVDAAGERVGHLEAIVAEREDDALTVIEYHVGELGLFERLSATSLLGTFVGWLVPGAHSGRKVPWEQMDLTDPEHPRTTVPKGELPKVRR